MQGYVNMFTSMQASTQFTDYVTFIALSSYNTIQCQQFCDAALGCIGFNIYFEHDPTLDLGSAAQST